jgi:hypothetical protein
MARGPGPPPGDPGRMVPMDILWKFSARVEQREKERQRDAAAAAENRKLVSAMLDACGQNIMTSADFDDLGAVKSMMAVGVTLDRVLSALKLSRQRVAVWHSSPGAMGAC